MCCSAWPASFSKTITGTWEVLVDGRVNHVLWYQNRIGHGERPMPSQYVSRSQILEVIVGARLAGGDTSNEHEQKTMKANGISEQDIENEIALRQSRPPRDLGPDFSGNGNCLIIPLLGTWESIRLLNTAQTPKLLQDVSDALAMPPQQHDGFGTPFLTAQGFGGGIVFLKFDIYDIVLAERAADIPAVLPQIRPEKRPQVNEAVFGMLDRWYMCPVAVCCFNDAQAGEAKPLGFAFEPLYPDKLVVYTLDGHDGNAPDPDKIVKIDHDIFVGSYLMQTDSHATIRYTDDIPEHLRPYLLNEALGLRMRETRMENGDFVFSTEHVRRGFFQGLRSLPPMAPPGIRRLGHMAVRQWGYI